MKPKIGRWYRHHNGNLYRILMLTNEHSTNPNYPITVVYEGANRKIWSKTLDRFNETMTEAKEKKHNEPWTPEQRETFLKRVSASEKLLIIDKIKEARLAVPERSLQACRQEFYRATREKIL